MITLFEDLFLDEQVGEDLLGVGEVKKKFSKKKNSVIFLIGPYQDNVAFTATH